MNKDEFIGKMLSFGAGLDQAASGNEDDLWIQEAKNLYDEHFNERQSTVSEQLRTFQHFCKDNYNLDIPDRIVDEFERYGSLDE